MLKSFMVAYLYLLVQWKWFSVKIAIGDCTISCRGRLIFNLWHQKTDDWFKMCDLFLITKWCTFNCTEYKSEAKSTLCSQQENKLFSFDLQFIWIDDISKTETSCCATAVTWCPIFNPSTHRRALGYPIEEIFHVIVNNHGENAGRRRVLSRTPIEKHLSPLFLGLNWQNN